jgi:hypothetical protein
MSTKEIQAQIEINASAERVWEILTNFDDFREWNTFIRPVVGRAEVGEKLRVQIRPPGGKPMAFQPRVTKVEPNRELRWLGHLWLPGLFDGEHIFTIEPLGPEKVRFVQREVFTGLLVSVMARNLEEQTLPGFRNMNQAIKERAEGSEGTKKAEEAEKAGEKGS